MHRIKNIILFTLALALLVPLPGWSQYKDYERKETRTKFFEVSFNKKTLTVSVFTGEDIKSILVNRSDLALTKTEVRINPEVSFTSAGLHFLETALPYSEITEAVISTENDLTKITFYSNHQQASRVNKTHAGNIVAFTDTISVKPGEFVRGLIFSVNGLITVSGEVNKDIISLFGDVTLTSGAVARGDIVSITGKIEIQKNASLYGEVRSGIKDYDSRTFRFNRASEFEPGITLDYNRIDGLLLGGELSFVDADSIYPSAKIGLGFALESERLRYFAEATQTISRQSSLTVGAELYKKLESDDNWLLSNAENAIFVLLATEDFKDYFETEGFAGWIGFEPAKQLNFKTGFRYDDTHWLRARQHLWSLFGGSKIFRENFSSVNASYRNTGIAEIDSTVTGVIFLNAVYDNHNPEVDSLDSEWIIMGDLEWSDNDMASDHDFRRYSLTAIRHQYLNEMVSLRLRGRFANSDGYLPMHKRYFIGGLGSLQGYKHKEFIGTRFWMVNTEFWCRPLKSKELELLLTWDVAQIANETKLDENAEVRHDLGVGFGVAGFRFDVTKRLDSFYDRDPKIYVRFARRF